MYKFVDLDHEQKLKRRELLDFYGLVAQLSVLVPILAIVVYRFATLGQSRLRDASSATPASPYAKAARLRHGLSFASVQQRWRQISWSCGDPVEIYGLYLGTKGDVGGALIWTLWLLVLSFLDTGDDYLHLTKRVGTIGASQLPFHYLLSVKSPWSPLQLLTGCSEASLISLHQLLGRIVSAFFWTHVILYVNFYVLNGLLLAKVKELYIICGVLAIISFTAISTTAFRTLRNKSYKVFYVTHVSLATVLLPVLYLHVHHIRSFVWETVAIYTSNAILRYFATRTHTGVVKKVRDASLVEITIPVSQGALRWQPGQFAYISLAGHPLLRTFRSNPFTVASVPAIDNQLKFVARILDGNTLALANSAKENQNISVEGPYGIASHADRLLGYDRIVFIAGGVGATFIVPLYRQLLSDLSPSKGSYRRQKVSFVWAARSFSEVTWPLLTNLKEKEGFIERLTVYVSRQVEGDATAQQESAFVLADEEELPGDEGIELEEQKNLLQGRGDDDRDTTTAEIQVRKGRPDLAQVVDQAFSKSSTERVAIVVCGPPHLSQSLRQKVGPWVKRGREVWFWDESFAL
ncbi:Putative ferric reductase, NAD binding domain, ferric reductase transmembrane component-like protein [Septoria linicola]|uniref:ferric-chelate reductase (NADPH) n=1 Tax=Septoria linicola TaxID=215465 RepID=A0A9Q9AJV5_9PEZI|nr:putative ferric reductase, NAD binding domain, ferric reductase transmembrane component-like protein [Septoria linicola]USW47770.1 Putative ferric reductase, NAD binding domain, ferric reductase transmembrane component-like protein [Septoria linicola]